MDTLTHITIGACTGELILGKKLGKKAMLFGAIAANIPDIDTSAGLFMRGDKALLFHRGITHSLLFALITGLLLAYIAKKVYADIELGLFAMFFCFELTLHNLLDTCTNYGTGLLEPFSHQRFSIHLLYVVDPVFTLPFLIATILLIVHKRPYQKNNFALTAVLVSTMYLCIAGYCKSRLDNKATLTTPAPFTTFLWYCIIKTKTGYYTNYQSVFDKAVTKYEYYPQNSFLLKQLATDLITFADGYYTISKDDHSTYMNILRFGQIQGWKQNSAPFVLSYPLKSNDNENMIIQKGRLKGWNRNSIKLYFKRIAGI